MMVQWLTKLVAVSVLTLIAAHGGHLVGIHSMGLHDPYEY